MSQLLAIAGLLGCIASGLTLARRGLGRGDDAPGPGFTTVLGLGLGLGLAAAVATIEAAFDRPPTALLRALEGGGGLLAVACWRRPRPTRRPDPRPTIGQARRAGPWLRIALASLIALFLLAFGLHTSQAPHGDYDALANWNQRARLLYHEPEVPSPRNPQAQAPRPQRREAFAGMLSMPHTDYPPLLPHTIVRLWRALARDPWWIPPLVGLALALGTVALLFGGLLQLRGGSLACVGACVLLGPQLLPRQAAGQMADVPVGFFYLATVACVALALQHGRPRPGPCLLAGAAAGAAMLTKNEGSLFALTFCACLCTVALWRHGRRGLWPCLLVPLGALPQLLALYCFRQGTPTNELLPFHRLGEVLEMALDGERWRTGLPVFVREVAWFGNGLLLLLAVVTVCLWRRRSAAEPQAIAGAALLSAFALSLLAYLTLGILSPYGTRYHFQSTQERLVLQWWPSLVFAAMLMVRDPFAASGQRTPAQPGTPTGPQPGPT